LNTIGIVLVAALAATAAGIGNATITDRSYRLRNPTGDLRRLLRARRERPRHCHVIAGEEIIGLALSHGAAEVIDRNP
jgi:hypothetical protein